MTEFNSEEYNSLFHQELSEFAEEYRVFLLTKFTKSTTDKHLMVIQEFGFYVTGYHPVNGFEELTVTLAGSKFKQYFNGMSDESLSTFTARNILYGFFLFIYEKHGIGNTAFIKKLKPKRMR